MNIKVIFLFLVTMFSYSLSAIKISTYLPYLFYVEPMRTTYFKGKVFTEEEKNSVKSFIEQRKAYLKNVKNKENIEDGFIDVFDFADKSHQANTHSNNEEILVYAVFVLAAIESLHGQHFNKKL